MIIVLMIFREISRHTSENELKSTSKSGTSNDNSCDIEKSINDMSHFKYANKKQAYLEQIIKDKNGVYRYIDDP